MSGLLTIARLTWLEARRRRLVLAALLGGLLFVIVYATAVFFIDRSFDGAGGAELMQQRAHIAMLVLAGLYVVNFLTIAVAILLPVDTLSGEIGSGVMQTLASKPIRRADIVLGKWLTYWLMTGAYLLLTAGGLVLATYLITGYGQQGLPEALPLIWLGATVLLTISIGGGVRLTTTTNGIVAFAFFGLAFIGGWIEQIGALTGNATTRYIGTAISLVSPSDAIWRRAAYELSPPLLREFELTPFTSVSTPSAAMIVWAVGFVLAVLALAVRAFRRRPL